MDKIWYLSIVSKGDNLKKKKKPFLALFCPNVDLLKTAVQIIALETNDLMPVSYFL